MGILVVMVVVVSAAMFYFYILLPGSGEVPETRLSKARAIGDNVWEVMVESASPTRSLYYYVAILEEDSHTITLEPLTGSSPGVTFIDHDGDWRLSSDDYFRLTCEPKSGYSFTLVYRTEMETLDTVEWQT